MKTFYKGIAIRDNEVIISDNFSYSESEDRYFINDIEVYRNSIKQSISEIKLENSDEPVFDDDVIRKEVLEVYTEDIIYILHNVHLKRIEDELYLIDNDEKIRELAIGWFNSHDTNDVIIRYALEK